MTKHIGFFLIFIVGLLVGCNRNKIFDRIIDLNDRSWPKNQSIDFQFTITDTYPAYNLSCVVRNSIHYKYYNLYLLSL